MSCHALARFPGRGQGVRSEDREDHRLLDSLGDAHSVRLVSPETDEISFWETSGK